MRELSDRAAIAKVLAEHQPCAVVHFAAKCYVGESVTDPAKYLPRERDPHVPSARGDARGGDPGSG
ncbi:MAG: GDP-mannose 4,6-dehydratase, partial [Planctomycetes bacterium]|nr:GDP-mannose 4,6-dehydratase [Planctomycetota bacterium]